MIDIPATDGLLFIAERKKDGGKKQVIDGRQDS
jgi:hypothetical protein